jgi:hypothetical protein
MREIKKRNTPPEDKGIPLGKVYLKKSGGFSLRGFRGFGGFREDCSDASDSASSSSSWKLSAIWRNWPVMEFIRFYIRKVIFINPDQCGRCKIK